MQVSMVQHLGKIKEGLSCHNSPIKQAIKIMAIDVILKISNNTLAKRLRQEASCTERVHVLRDRLDPGETLKLIPLFPDEMRHLWSGKADSK